MCATTTMDTLRIITILFSLIAAAISTAGGHNITEILSDHPEYTQYNTYLSETKLDDEINSRQTITILVLNNAVLTKFLANETLSVVKTVLSVHVLLDYFDQPKLLDIGGGSVITTTLYQTTGTAIGTSGFVNITDLTNGTVGFGPVSSRTRLNSVFIKSVKQIPYNISVVEIDFPIIPPGILVGGAPVDVNITRLLESVGCKTFARLVSVTGVLRIYDAVSTKGLTLFAPSDAAFSAPGAPDLDGLTNAELTALLLFHACSNYIPRSSLRYERNPIHTLATNTAGRFDLNVRTSGGDSVMIESGIDSARVESTVIDSVPISIFKIEKVLLPLELFNKSPAPAPEGSTSSSPTNAPKSIALAPAPVKGTLVNGSSPVRSPPSPLTSPPAPSTPSVSAPVDGPSPAENPAADAGNSNGADVSKVSLLSVGLITVMVSGIITSFFGA